ncbi:MAG: thioredoxin [Actinomycetia bacterium]|nr:thioredoxin [Actinomycetes bacterium]
MSVLAQARSTVLDVTDATFATEVLMSDRPVVVDYWADWCAPCKQLAPIIDELARQYDGRVAFRKVDTNANPGIAMRQGVMALPTVQIFVRGELVGSLQGGRTKGTLIKAIDEALDA